MITIDIRCGEFLFTELLAELLSQQDTLTYFLFGIGESGLCLFVVVFPDLFCF